MFNSVNPPQTQSNISASNIGQSKTLKAGHFVITPPEILPYSFYDDLKKSENYYKEALNIIANKKTPNKSNTVKAKWKKIISIAVVITTSIFAYKNWASIVNFIKNIKK